MGCKKKGHCFFFFFFKQHSPLNLAPEGKLNEILEGNQRGLLSKQLTSSALLKGSQSKQK